MKKQKCSQWFSETIRETMKEMGREKSRPQVIAISAKRTMKEHPECKRFLDRPQQKIKLDEKHWIVWSSKSFRLYRSSPSSLRVFFLKRASPSMQWKQALRQLFHERLGISLPVSSVTVQDNFLEIPINNPKLILSILKHRVANFLD